jgi:hypothetical protein
VEPETQPVVTITHFKALFSLTFLFINREIEREAAARTKNGTCGKPSTTRGSDTPTCGKTQATRESFPVYVQ